MFYFDLVQQSHNIFTDLVSLNNRNHFVLCTDVAILPQVHLAANHCNLMRL
jgi:hypothetical protein